MTRLARLPVALSTPLALAVLGSLAVGCSGDDSTAEPQGSQESPHAGRSGSSGSSGQGGVSGKGGAGGTSAGGANTGGTSAGGTSAGGANTGGTAGSGVPVGGANTGGTTGGASGASAGGASAGGASAGGASAGTAGTVGGVSGSGGSGQAGTSSGPCQPLRCSDDGLSLLDCKDSVVQACPGTTVCNSELLACADPCQVGSTASLGCEFYATYMDTTSSGARCFAMFVSNTSFRPTHLTVSYDGATLPVGSFARIPQGSGAGITYAPYDDVAGLAPGQLAVLFLAGPTGTISSANAPCPVDSARGELPSQLESQSGIGRSFRLQTDGPVSAYQINPYGGGSAAVTGASLLLPTSVWNKAYVAVNAGPQLNGSPSLNIVASKDNTEVTILPKQAVTGGGGLPGGPAGQPLTFTLQAGQQAQFTQPAELTGSFITSSNPIGVMGGHQCLNAPAGVPYCDHAEQMLPPVQALGHRYAGVQYRPRRGEPGIWHVVGAVDGTNLTWSSSVGGPATLQRGQSAEFVTGTPFTVESQDADHPFYLISYMSGSTWNQGNKMEGYGDADFSLSTPIEQYLKRYVIFTDPTYPETNLVLVRRKVSGVFADVTLDCAGVLGNWQPLGDQLEWTRADLSTGNFQNVGNCSNGRHELTSPNPFGLWVWGWGTPETSFFTSNVSYSYPGGMNLQTLNEITKP